MNIDDLGFSSFREFIHFGCTSQDINNTSVPLLLKEGLSDTLYPVIDELLELLKQLGNDWYVNSAPIITADWKAADGQQWIVPLGMGGGKLMYLGGKLPLNLQSQIFYNVVRPDFGPEWQWRLQAQILLPMGKKDKK